MIGGFLYGFEFSAQIFLEQGEVRAVEEQVGAKLEEPHLLLQAAPEVNVRLPSLLTYNS